MSTPKPRAVVFTGAGFSKGLGLPLTSELWDLGLQKNPEAEKTGLMWDAMMKCPPLTKAIEANHKDVEVLLNDWEAYIEEKESKRPMPNNNDSGRGALKHYVTNLCMHLDQLGRKSLSSSLGASLVGWLDKANQKLSLSFVTTNYDTCVEQAIHTLKIGYSYVTPREDAIPMRKLHGSINWIAFSGQPKRYTDGWKPELIGKVRRDDIYDCRLEEIPWVAGQIPPIIIPPVKKKEYQGIFTKQLDGARELIFKADRVMFVGYSFPPADKELGEFVEKAVKDSPCKRFHFVSPDKAARGRAEAILKGKDVSWHEDRWEIAHLDEFVF